MRERPAYTNNPESKDDRSRKEQEGVSRREFLKKLGKAGAATAAAGLWGDDLFEYIFTDEEAGLRKSEGERLNQERKKVKTEDLAGRQLNGLYKLHIGLSTEIDFDEPMVVPEEIEADYTEQLGALWHTKRVMNEDLKPVAARTGNKLINEYADLTPVGVSLEMYKNEIDRVTADLHNRLDWSKIQNKYYLTDRGGRLLTEIADSVGGRELSSYALTELMPSSDGDLNAEVMDFMLQNAGREYVERIPAVYDEYTSFGPYQFTSQALFSTPEEKRGASRVAEHVTDGGIPGSVSKLRGVDHHQVAYLLAVQNLAELIDRLSIRNLANLENRWQEEMSGIAQFIAAAHNYPYSTDSSNGALQAGEYWIANDMEKDFVVSAGRKPRPYAAKTRENYEALT